MKYAKDAANWRRANNKLETVQAYNLHWSEKYGTHIPMRTADDRVAIIEITDEELDAIVAARDAARQRASEYKASGNHSPLSMYGFAMTLQR